MRFNVKAVHIDGDEHIASVDAPSAAALSERLRDEGYSVTSITRAEPGLVERMVRGSRRESLAAVCQQLATLVDSGIAMPAAFRAIARDMRTGALPAALEEAARSVERGESLQNALASSAAAFPPLFRFVVRTGCAAGRLAPALLLMSDYYETTTRLRQRAVEACIYPAIVVAALISLAVYTAHSVLPKFLVMFDQYRHPLPAPTRVAIAVSQQAGEWLPWAGVALLALLIAAWATMRDHAVRYAASRALFALPLAGGLARAYAVAKLSAGLSLLLRNQVPAPDALALLADMESSPWLAEAMRELAERVERGETMSDAMADSQTRLFPSTFVWIISAADGTAGLADATERMAGLYGEIVRRRFTALSIVLLPTAVVILGLMTLTFAAVVLLPLLESFYMV